MSISFHCDCGRKIVVDEKHAGRRGKCPDCGKIVKVPESNISDVVPLIETSACLGCGEPIPDTDVICLHCGFNQITREGINTQVGEVAVVSAKSPKLSQEQRNRIVAEMPLWVTRAIAWAPIFGIILAIAGCLSVVIVTEPGFWGGLRLSIFWAALIGVPISTIVGIAAGLYALTKRVLQKQSYLCFVGSVAAVVLCGVMLWLLTSDVGLGYEPKGKRIIADFPALAKAQESTDKGWEKELRKMDRDKKLKSYSITHTSTVQCSDLTLTEAEEKYGAPERKEPPGKDEFRDEDIDIIWWYWRVGLAANADGDVLRLLYRRHVEKNRKK